MSEELLKALLEIPQVVEIINNCGLGIKTEIKKILKIARKNDISVDVVNNIAIREDGRKKIYQTSIYTILNNGAYYVHHDWDKNQRLRGRGGGAFTLVWPLGVWLQMSHEKLYIKYSPK